MPDLRILALAALASLAAAGATLRTAGAVDIVVTQYNGDLAGAPYAIALDQGFFKQAGSNVTGVISTDGGGTSIRTTIASDFGYGEASGASVISAIKEGQDLKIVDLGSRNLATNVVIVMPNSPIKSVADAKGHKWGITNPQSVSQMTAALSVEKAGLKPSDVQLVTLGGGNGVLTGLETGAVDIAGTTSGTFRMRGGESKYRILVRGKDLPALPTAVGIATGKLIREHPDQLRALLAARRMGVQFIYAHPQEAAKILTSLYQPLPADVIQGMIGELVEARYWSEGNIEMTPLDNQVEAMKLVGVLKDDVDLNAMIDRSFLPADLQK